MSSLLLYSDYVIFVLAFANLCSVENEYRCYDIHSVIQCQIIEECRDGAWRNWDIQKDETCSACHNFVEDVRIRLTSDNRAEDAPDFMSSACKMFTNAALIDECNALVESRTPDITEVIKANVESRIICGLLKFCGRREENLDKPFIKKLDKSETEVTTQNEPNDQNICSICLLIFKGVHDLLSSNNTLVELQTFIDNEICANLKLVERECESIVKIYLPQLLQLLTNKCDPNEICQYVGCCSYNDRTNQDHPLATACSDSSPSGSLNKAVLLCKVARQHDQLKRDVENFVQTEICSRFATEGTDCGSLSRQFQQSLIELLLIKKLNIQDRCPAEEAREMRDKPSDVDDGNKIENHPNSVEKSSPVKCEVCWTIIKKFKHLFKTAGTVADAVCDSLQQDIQFACSQIIAKRSVDDILLLIMKGETPISVCNTFNLCYDDF